MSNRAWVTLSTNDSYSLGALVLAHSLRRVGSVYPAVLLITPSVTDAMRERLRAVFTDVIVVDVLDSRDATHLALLQRPELGITFTKIHCWSLTQFEKCVFLDADTLVVQNCDELFEREELSAAPDVGWPDCFNSGVFVYRPSQGTFDALIQFAKERGSFDGGDQGLLNSYFSGWARGDINKHLPFLYNVTSAAFYSYLPALKHFGSDLKIIHFIGAAKPWLQTYNWESQSVDSAGHLKDTLQLWWEIFVSSVHPQLDVTMVGGGGPPELPPTDTLNYYVPEVDPDSIFPWHQMITTRAKEEEEKTKLDLSIFFDPWDLYRGDIPLKEEFQPSNVSRIPGRVEVTQELRDYVWQYKDQQQNSSTSNVHDTQELSSLELSERSHEHHDHHSHHSHRQLSLAPNESHSIHQPHFSHNHDSHFSHKQAHDSNVDDSSQSHHNYQHNDCQHDKEDYSLTGDTWISNTQVKSQNNHSLHRSEIHAPHLHGNHHNIEQVHHVRLDVQKRPLKIGKKKTKRLHRIDICDGTGVMNGDISSEDEEMEVEQPKHPYDGFYLRHRATIDPNGRKICTHQLPPTPPPSPPPESPESNDNEEVEQDLIDQQTGVAGNLARVVPGAISSQREVLDELTRRQGWEAGNIDYLGADSFDNIWAKISQTLNQAPKQASPPKEEAPTPETPASPLQDPSPPAKEPSPSNEQLPLAKQPSAAKEVTPDEPTSVKQSGPAKEASIEPKAQEIPATVEAVLTQPALAESPKEVAAVKTILSVTASAGQQKSESAIPATPPVTPSETASTTPVAETAPVLEALTPVEVPKTPEVETSLSKSEATPDKTLELSDVSTDSPPLANTPSKDEVQSPKAAKSEGERARKPAGKLQLRPPGIADPLPTPDSEFEDAASLAQSIIASELATPTVTSPTPPAPLTPASAPPALQQKRLSVDEPLPTTPPAGPVSLAQIGVKPKPSIAAQIESSVTDKPEVAIPPPEITTTPTTPSEPSTPTEVPKKKLVKKSVKKEGSGVGADAPVPPPRKKEKKPKEK